MSPERQTQTTNNQSQAIRWSGVFVSASLFASVYLILYVAYQASTAAVANYFLLEPVLYMDHVQYLRGDLWYPHAVKRTFLFGAVFMSAVSVGIAILYAVLRKHLIFIRLFLIWGFVISTAMVAQRLIGVLIAGNFQFRMLGELGLELSVFGAYMYFKQGQFMAMAIVGVLLLPLIGFLVGKPFLQTAWSSDQIGSESTRFHFLKQLVVLPFLIGAGLVTVITFPDSVVTNVLGFFCIGVMLSVAFVRAMLLGPMIIPRQRKWEQWPIVPILLLITIVALSKTILSEGIPFAR